MLKPLLACTAALVAACGVVAQTAPGSAPVTLGWSVEPTSEAGSVQLALTRRNGRSNWMHSNTTPLADLQGLDGAALAGAGGPVRFRLARDGGTLDCEGVARRGRGTGECRFTGDRAFAETLRRRGIGTPTEEQLFTMALGRTGPAYLAELDRQNYARPTLANLVDAGNHAAGLPYLREIGALGYRAGSVPALIRMRDHGVTASYVRQLAAAGLAGMPADTVVRLRDHGVSASFVGALRRLGHDLPPDAIIRLRDHVSETYLTELDRLGYRRLSAEELVSLRSHGVTASYVQSLLSAGYPRFSADELVRLRSHGVTADFARRVGSGGKPSADELVRLRTGG